MPPDTGVQDLKECFLELENDLHPDTKHTDWLLGYQDSEQVNLTDRGKHGSTNLVSSHSLIIRHVQRTHAVK